MTRPLAAALVALAALSPVAMAQEGSPDSANGRFTFSPVTDGVLRLDTRTGDVSLCSRRTAGWACQATPDDRAVLEKELARLESENAALKQQLASRGAASGEAAPVKPGERSPSVELKLPSDAEIDKVMAFFEKIWRRLVEMMQSVQREAEKKS